ncbi:unnamed protein product [Closterium sp. Naga37s-1]|nr:unnamed protein product [Closterium sp. Naga37s-1]
MVIAGAPEPSPERAAAWSAAIAKPQTEPEKATTAMKPPLPPAPKPGTTISEMPPPLVPGVPAAVTAPGQSAPVAALSAPAAATIPLAPPVGAPTSIPATAVADPPVPIPVAPIAPPAAVPVKPALAADSSPQAASATTGGLTLFGAPLVAEMSPPAVLPTAPMGPQDGGSAAGCVQCDARGEGGAEPEPFAAGRAGVRSRLRLPPVPPVAGVEFVAAGGGAARAAYPPLVAGGPASLAADEPLPFLAEALQPPQTRVPEAMLAQLSRLAESLHALLLIQVLAHSSLPAIPAETFHDRPREVCLDTADQLALLLAPVLAMPTEGGAAAVG